MAERSRHQFSECVDRFPDEPAAAARQASLSGANGPRKEGHLDRIASGQGRVAQIAFELSTRARAHADRLGLPPLNENTDDRPAQDKSDSSLQRLDENVAFALYHLGCLSAQLGRLELL